MFPPLFKDFTKTHTLFSSLGGAEIAVLLNEKLNRNTPDALFTWISRGGVSCTATAEGFSVRLNSRKYRRPSTTVYGSGVISKLEKGSSVCITYHAKGGNTKEVYAGIIISLLVVALQIYCSIDNRKNTGYFIAFIIPIAIFINIINYRQIVQTEMNNLCGEITKILS